MQIVKGKSRWLCKYFGETFRNPKCVTDIMCIVKTSTSGEGGVRVHGAFATVLCTWTRRSINLTGHRRLVKYTIILGYLLCEIIHLILVGGVFFKFFSRNMTLKYLFSSSLDILFLLFYPCIRSQYLFSLFSTQQ